MKLFRFRSSQEFYDSIESEGFDARPTRTVIAWCDAIERGMHLSPFYLVAKEADSSSEAMLPLMLMHTRLFGRFLVSLPYLNSGGLLHLDKRNVSQELAKSLIDLAVALADELDVKHLELRHESRFEHPAFNYERTDKVHMRLALPSSAEQLMSAFKSKLRSQVKKASENRFEVQFGGEILLEDFYKVFAHNMRDLGTPVYSKDLFRQILKSFASVGIGSKAELCLVKLNNRPISGALLVHHAGRTEIPSASALREFNPTNVNMWMYWQLLQRAIEMGSIEFDFGRSTIGSGTYKFKEQWGAKPYPAIWQYYVRKGDPSDMRPDSPTKVRFVNLWKKLPLWLTRLVGPSIVRGIP